MHLTSRILTTYDNIRLSVSSLGDKLRILVALLHQVLTFVSSRDMIEENYDNLKTAKLEIRQLQAAEQRREKDEAQFW